jgi:hypothetical protein
LQQSNSSTPSYVAAKEESIGGRGRLAVVETRLIHAAVFVYVEEASEGEGRAGQLAARDALAVPAGGFEGNARDDLDEDP